ncbi:MAG: nucleotidyltransferase domain-containing protein [Nanoarchaeota archaeon]|nr:nucleotidyltransferase domain-containing protein [Nanoarchaeota archaeon]
MLTKEEIKIVELFRKDLFKEYTIKEIQAKIAKKSYNWVFEAVKKLDALNLIKIEKKGASNICSLNLDNHLTLSYLALLEEFNVESKKLPKKNINELINTISLGYFTFIIAGSYVEGKTSKTSDLDIVVIAGDDVDTRRILTILKNKGSLMVPETHPYVFTKTEFLKMLLNNEENYGKMIYRKRLIAFGAENYYLIIREAIKNGFKG